MFNAGKLCGFHSQDELRKKVDTLLPNWFNQGLRKPTPFLTMGDIPDLVKGTIHRSLLLASKAETDQFIEGK